MFCDRIFGKAMLTLFKSASIALFTIIGAFTLLMSWILFPVHVKAEESAIGVIESAYSEDKTVVRFLDEKFSEVKKCEYNYLDVFIGGFDNALEYGPLLYLSAKTMQDENGLVICLDTRDGLVNEYPTGRNNVISIDADSEYIYALSNLNMTSYVDRISVKDKSITSTQTEELILDDAKAKDGLLYCFGIDPEDESGYYLCRIDFSTGKIDKLLHLEHNNPPSFIELYENKLIYTFDGKLCLYDIASEKEEQIELSSDKAYNLKVCGDYLYIGYTDVFGADDSSQVEVMDMKSGEFIKDFECKGTIMQIEPVDEEGKIVCIGNDDEIMVYDLSGSRCKVVNSYKYEKDESYYVGGFFLVGDNIMNTSNNSRTKLWIISALVVTICLVVIFTVFISRRGKEAASDVEAAEYTNGETVFESEEEMEKARIEEGVKYGISEEEMKAYQQMVEELWENVEVYPDDEE